MNEELETRTKRFALIVIRLVGKLPRSKASDVIGHRLLKSGTSIGANYREANRARSRDAANPQSAIRNPQSAIRNPRSAIHFVFALSSLRGFRMCCCKIKPPIARNGRRNHCQYAVTGGKGRSTSRTP